MTTMTPARRTVNRKPTRRTARLAAPFGAGIYPTRTTRFEPSDEDRAAAAAMFGVDADWPLRLIASECEACGRPVECGEIEGGLCNVCQCRAEAATMASQYAAAGMGWRSY